MGHNIYLGHSASTYLRCPYYKLQLHIEETKLLHGLLVRRGTYAGIFASVYDTKGYNIFRGHIGSPDRKCPQYKPQLHIEEKKSLHGVLVRRGTYASIF